MAAMAGRYAVTGFAAHAGAVPPQAASQYGSLPTASSVALRAPGPSYTAPPPSHTPTAATTNGHLASMPSVQLRPQQAQGATQAPAAGAAAGALNVGLKSPWLPTGPFNFSAGALPVEPELPAVPPPPPVEEMQLNRALGSAPAELNGGAVGGGVPRGVEAQLQELLEGQQRLQREMEQMRAQVSTNYHECMEAVGSLRLELTSRAPPSTVEYAAPTAPPAQALTPERPPAQESHAQAYFSGRSQTSPTHPVTRGVEPPLRPVDNLTHHAHRLFGCFPELAGDAGGGSASKRAGSSKRRARGPE